MSDDYASHKPAIRILNDRLRANLDPATGRIVMTAGVASLPMAEQADLLNAVRTFDAFTPDNDPHEEHDFGAVELNGERYFWKIDTYDRTMTYHSPRPWDDKATVRVLTIMCADEY